MYESSLKFQTLLGRNLREAIERLGRHDDLEELGTINKGFVTQFGRCRKLYGDVRQSVAAHKDASASRQLHLIESVDPETVAQLAIELLHWTNSLHAYVAAFTRSLLAEAPEST